MTESIAEKTGWKDIPLDDALCFIETQFPVAKISMESYKERKSNYSQTLTGLGKWWGRKPLILVRAALLGLLMPASDSPEKDREIFLKLLTMDGEGLWLRKSKSIPGNRLLEELLKMPPSTQQKFLDKLATSDKPKLRRFTRNEDAEREELQALVFSRMSYSEKITYCDRPEQLEGPSESAWDEINSHLNTKASSLSELLQELGEKRFGHTPRVGDAFCGGGSIPFEAARIGCDSFGSDLNPVATLLSWAALNIVGGGRETAEKIHEYQQEIYDAVDSKIIEWGIEHNSLGWRADAFLYCLEVLDPETGWRIPLAPSWVIGKSTRTIAKLIPNEDNKRYDIEIIQGASDDEVNLADRCGTIDRGRVINPKNGSSIPVNLIRKNLRNWENNDLVPRPDDVFQERLYCIRWIETNIDDKGKERTKKHYRAPTSDDFRRESKVIELLSKRFSVWQQRGCLPKRYIQPGEKTSEPIQTRGWTHWHHLFSPRQLLVIGLYLEEILNRSDFSSPYIGVLLGIGRILDWNSKLSVWDKSAGNERLANTFLNQALNPLYNQGVRPNLAIANSWFWDLKTEKIIGKSKIIPGDARAISDICDIWITDPPYADAVNYHELSEFFLSWYESYLKKHFKGWYVDSKRSLAVKGAGQDFRKVMVDCYKNLTQNSSSNGIQIVMFTHQDASVWADLTMILWASGLRVTAAWTIATETDSALKAGNYVQGTVLLVLRKRVETEPVFLDEISYKVEAEVRRQLDSMVQIEDDSDPNFGDADYQLAAYAAALRVLTGQPIEEIDPEKEILRERQPGEVSPVEELIRRAVKIACDHLIPKGLNSNLWKSFGPMERFYIKGLEVESHGEYRSGVYQELARGFGATDYTDLLESTRANETRLKSASEFGKKMLGSCMASESFADSLMRQCLFAVWLTVRNEETREGLDYLHTELRDAYWANREKITGILDYLASLRFAGSMNHWRKDAEAASLLGGAVRNDHV